MDIVNFHHQELEISQFHTLPGQSWCVLGENRSGIDCFVDLLSGKLTHYRADSILLPNKPGVLSFRAQQDFFEEEIRNDDSDFLNRTDPGTLVREYLAESQHHFDLLQAFSMAHCLDLGYRQLSSGQARKLLLLRELTDGTATLLLQNPYDGLDGQSCRELNHALRLLPARGIEIVVCINNQSDIPDWVSHLAIIHAGRLMDSGARDEILPKIDRQLLLTRSDNPPLNAPLPPSSPKSMECNEELVYLHSGFAGYGDRRLFQNLDMTIRTGDHTLITGPNGCGKSTLLDIIIGDNPKCYANDLRIFGKKRGSGESIWEIKRHMGIVSPTLHREHRVPDTALQVVLSGLFDSIGLYQKATSTEIKTARQWLAWIHLPEKADVPFRRLSFAEQRQVLIARALIKGPKLLILDEPTQGLDDGNRHALLILLEEIAARNLCTILFVSHRQDEHRPFFKQQIRLDAHAA